MAEFTVPNKIEDAMQKGGTAIGENFDAVAEAITALQPTSGVLDSIAPFVDYTTKKATGAIHWTKQGSIVEVSGEITVTSTIAGNSGAHTIVNLPGSLQPKNYKSAMMQGSFVSHFQIGVRPTGELIFDRFGAGAETLDFNAGSWGPFVITYSVDD